MRAMLEPWPSCALARVSLSDASHEASRAGPRGVRGELLATLGAPRGEFTLVISGLEPAASTEAPAVGAVLDAGRRSGLTDRTLVDLLRALGVSRRDAYRRISGR